VRNLPVPEHHADFHNRDQRSILLLKSELDRGARHGLDAAMEAVGLLPFKGRVAAWRSADRRLVIWVLGDSKAQDPYRGSAFTIEFEHSHDGTWMKKLAGRATLGGLLSDGEFEGLVPMQRAIIRSLGRPPESHVEAVPQSLRARYLNAFDAEAVIVRGDFWMRYAVEDHLDAWWSVIADLLPPVVDRAWTLDPHKLHREVDGDGALIVTTNEGTITTGPSNQDATCLSQRP
jgi:hypothetical protein